MIYPSGQPKIMSIRNQHVWNRKYMGLAAHIATWSKDPRKQVGAVAIGDQGQMLSQGYNGFPRGMRDDVKILATEEKLKYIVHAELNCIYNASLSGTSLLGATLYVSGFPPCSVCAGGIIQSGIKIVYCNQREYDDMAQSTTWSDSLKSTERMFAECGVSLRSL